MKYTTWSEEMEELLKQLMTEKKSLTAISCKLKVSRKALISYLRRHGYTLKEINALV